MRTSINSDFLTELQLVALDILLKDGEWHDRKDIHKKIGFKKFSYSIISERIIKPLEKKGIVEQEERPGTKKKFIRIKRDLDEQSLNEFHLLVEYSSNNVVMKYRKKDAERANLFLEMRNRSIKKLSELEEIQEKKEHTKEAEYWAKRNQKMDSDSWRKLVDVEKLIYETLKPGCKDCCKTGKCREANCYPLKKPGLAFKIAVLLNPKLRDEIIQKERNEAISAGMFTIPH